MESVTRTFARNIRHDLIDGSPFAIVLAGGGGTRLLPMVEYYLGHRRPKQYCILYGTDSLLGSGVNMRNVGLETWSQRGLLKWQIPPSPRVYQPAEIHELQVVPNQEC